jgi:uncharacterized protein
MIDIEDGKKAVVFARKIIEQYVKSKEAVKEDLEGVFKEKQGAFVTIHSFPFKELRGCIGIPLPVMPLKDAIIEGAISATRDPRFPPLSSEELDKIVIEVTILSPPEKINVQNPEEYLKEVEIGRDGLIAEQGFNKGLLLPQVPVEQRWDKEEFLKHTCMKAGLMPDAWLDKATKILRFTGQVFTEIKPRGDIKEKKLDG